MKRKYDLFERIQEHKQCMAKYIAQIPNLYLLKDMMGNIGDHLIWAGTREILDDLSVYYQEITIQQIRSRNSLNTGNECLLIPGSGAFDERWHEWLPQLVIDASKTFGKVLILPSAFDASVPIVKECLQKKNVYAFAREPASFCAIKSIGNVSLAFDCALYFDFQRYRKPNAAGTLCALREDAGSLIDRSRYAISASNNDISLTTRSLDEWLMQIANAAVIITDRLHVAVASIMLQKELVYLDPYNKKISTYLDYIFSKTTPDKVKQVDCQWLLNNKYIEGGER